MLRRQAGIGVIRNTDITKPKGRKRDGLSNRYTVNVINGRHRVCDKTRGPRTGCIIATTDRETDAILVVNALHITDKARKVREMFDAQLPNDLLVAHDELAAALDSLHNSPERTDPGKAAPDSDGT